MYKIMLIKSLAVEGAVGVAPGGGGGGECGLNRVYLAAGCVCVGRTPRASCQIDPIWCSSVSGPRELNNLNPGASPYLNYLIGAGN